jgi:hypothetical protein
LERGADHLRGHGGEGKSALSKKSGGMKKVDISTLLNQAVD